ncbi:MAG: DUF1540 domain-containing protein [Cellulosilyticaceae bacterium]
MTKLNCCAVNCTHNESNHCCLNQISIEGAEAGVPSETCCDNFLEKGNMTNHVTEPNEAITIECRATKCIHNQNCKCDAEGVAIVGQDATSSDGTQCNAFCKC